MRPAVRGTDRHGATEVNFLRGLETQAVGGAPPLSRVRQAGLPEGGGTSGKGPRPRPCSGRGVGQGAVLVSTLWGLLYWKEFKGANKQVMRMMAVMIALFVVGLGLISVAPLFA